MPLTLRDDHCNCHLPAGYSDQCTAVTIGLPGRPGALEVRAIQRRSDRLKKIQDHSPTLYALRCPFITMLSGYLQTPTNREIRPPGWSNVY
ncbi:hypothetical protein [Streptomyces mirabilis]